MILLAACGLAAGCSTEPSASAEPQSVAIVAERPQALAERKVIEAIGTARAVISAELYPESAGAVEAVNFTTGDYVRKNAPLVELDARRQRLAVDLAQVQVEEAQQLLDRYRRIEDTGALSASQIEEGETALRSAQLELRQARVALADRTVRAPFSGYMGLPQIDRGDRITPTTLIARLDRRDRLFVDFDAPETAFDQLRDRSVLELRPYSQPDSTVRAQVEAIDSTVGDEARTFTVRTIIDNRDDTFRPGMSFGVRIAGSGRTYPSVPEAAVVWGGDGAYIWVVRDGTAHKVPITIAGRRDGRVLVGGALDARMPVIVEGVQKVREGQTVRTVAQARARSAAGRVQQPDRPNGRTSGTDSATDSAP
ncbi:efflux RND transporter periplasmic adaptor subunit [Stakelama saccharophila]|uniref:Efflux RND transporter periplasmic adaptor subunit n=1 Tax=Stakelama saccharophila TaxID=3075605 RepID=A0ABZ0B9T6_9SPHN|nr:efflux RND transporter periplasmic adaptor subunit [Stakelama sp. W311]WNO54048.1 efflux RND transporter periplasmic adaptor subunit [Stakelama sp. W311]